MTTPDLKLVAEEDPVTMAQEVKPLPWREQQAAYEEHRRLWNAMNPMRRDVKAEAEE